MCSLRLLPRSIVVLLAFLSITHTGVLFGADDSERPNVLFVFADDWGRYAGAYADIEPGGPCDIISTPNFDRIADEGVLFTNAFVNAPSCTPCRSSLLSGQYFWRTERGAILQGAIWDETIPTYPLLLEDAGYHIGFSHKVWSPGTPRDAPYGGSANAYHRHGGSICGYSQFVSKADDHEAAHQQIMEQVRGNFQDFLSEREGRPFCYWFGPTNTHRTWIKGSGKNLWGLNPDDLEGKMPEFLPDVHAVREDFADYLGEAQAVDAALGVLLEELEKSGRLDDTLIVVSGDHGIPGYPRGKCNLYDLGVGVPLAVRWPSQIPGGRVVDDFVCLPDLAPTFLDAGGTETPDVMTGRSLMPILTSEKSGLVDPNRTDVIVGRERHVARARPGALPYPQRAVRNEDFLYIRNFKPDRWPMGVAPGYGLPDDQPMPDLGQIDRSTFAAFGDLDASPTKTWIIEHRADEGMDVYMDYAFGRRPAEELYDLSQDADEILNVADDPAYADVKAELSERLMSVLRETGDPRVVEDPVRYELPPYAGE